MICTLHIYLIVRTQYYITITFLFIIISDIIIGQNNLINDAKEFLNMKTTSTKSKVMIDINDDYLKKKRIRPKASIEEIDTTTPKKRKQKHITSPWSKFFCF